MRISFLVPVINERSTVLELLERVDALGLERQVIVVDDGSTDGTAQLLREWHGRHPEDVLLTQANGGKGAALRAGIPFRSEVPRSHDLRENGFSIEPELTAKVCKQKLRVDQLPISYYGRTDEEGKKITWRDGFRAIWVLLRVRVRD